MDKPPAFPRSARLGSLARVLLAMLLLLAGTPSQAQMPQNPPSEWGVVLGGDRSAAAASEEVNRNARILGQRPRVYLCNGWYRTVAAFASKRQALLGLQKVLDAGSRRSPYLIPIREWCPGKRLMPGG